MFLKNGTTVVAVIAPNASSTAARPVAATLRTSRRVSARGAASVLAPARRALPEQSQETSAGRKAASKSESGGASKSLPATV